MHGNAPPPGGYGAPPPGGFGAPPGYTPPAYAPPNPYAPPNFGPQNYGAMTGYGMPMLPYGTANSVVPAWLGKALLATSFWWLLLVAMIVALGFSEGGEHPDGPASVGVLAMFASFGLLFLHQIGSVYWQYRAWAGILPEFRRTQSGRMIAPGEAAGFLFIPYFNIYWMFVAAGGIADAANFQAEAYGSPLRVSRGNATLAATLQLLFPFLAGIFWYRLTRDVEAATSDARARAAAMGRPY